MIHKLVLLGSTDHGKSTLLGRILLDTGGIPQSRIDDVKKTCKERGMKDLELGFLVDYLREERITRKTIGESQVTYRHKDRQFTLVDVPGHLEFFTAAASGATQADSVLFIFDVTEGVTEQTVRHAHLLKFMSTKSVIAVYNKLDAIEYDMKRYQEAKKTLDRLITKVGCKITAHVPISALTGFNVSTPGFPAFELGGALLDVIAEQIPPTDTRSLLPSRIEIQDKISMPGEDIYMGVVRTGSIKLKDFVVGGFPRMTGEVYTLIDGWGRPIESASAGDAIGLTFDPTTLAPDRGDILTPKYQALVFFPIGHGTIFWLDDEPLKIVEGEKTNNLVLRAGFTKYPCTGISLTTRTNTATAGNMKDLMKLEKTNIADAGFLVKALAFETFANNPYTGRFSLLRDGKTVAGGIFT